MAGMIALFGSGETARHGRQVHERLLAHAPRPPTVAILDTPAGFQPNVDAVSARVQAFFEHNLQNYHPEVLHVPARARDGAYPVDAPAVLAALERADLIFAGPGSPTYAARVLAGSRAAATIVRRVRGGAHLSLASAAALAFGRYVVPVYEIFKAGDDLGWRPGVDLFAAFGLNLTVVPHWNNTEGGADLDTSHCYMGAERFEALYALLPGPTTILAIDEHTACTLDPDAGSCRVSGAGGVYVIGSERPDTEHAFAKGDIFPLDLLRLPDAVAAGA